jgi:hypothetical protein
MKRAFSLVFVGLLLGNPALRAEAVAGQDKQHKDSKGARARDDNDRGGAVVSIDVHFSTREVQVIRAHYAPKRQSLPPGLQKKIRRGGQLPPGWQKKLQPFPPALERQLVALPSGYRRGVIDGHAVIYMPGTQVVVDLALLF